MLGCACLACCDSALTHINLNLHALYAIIKQPFHKLYYLTRGENIFIFPGLLATHAHTSAFVTKTSEKGKTQNTTYSPEWGIIYFALCFNRKNVCKFGQLKYLFYCELPSDVIYIFSRPALKRQIMFVPAFFLLKTTASAVKEF